MRRRRPAFIGLLASLVVLGTTVVPSGAAAAGPNAGDVLIADTNASRVVLKPAGGGPQTVFFADGGGRPNGVAVDRQGNVYVSDTANRVLKLPADGSAQSTVASGLNVPVGIAVDSPGNVFIADRGNNRVVKVPAGGGSPTTVGTGLSRPQGVAVDRSGNVFIADRDNDRVVLVPSGGGAQTTVGTGLDEPVGVAVDAAGNVFIADGGNARVVKVPPGGGAQTTVGSGFVFPGAVAVAANGDLYVADPSGNQVVKVPADGGAQSSVGEGLSLPAGVAVHAPPPTLTADSPPSARRGIPYTYTFRATVPAGQPAATFVVASGSLPPGLALNAETGALSGSPSQTGTSTFRIEARNAATGTVGRLNTVVVGAPITPGDLFIADGSGLLQHPVGGGQESLGSGLFAARALAVDADGDVFLADTSFHRVLKIPADTQIEEVVASPSVDFGPFGLWVSPAEDDLFIANTGVDARDRDRVYRKLPTGVWEPVGSSLSGPQGVARDIVGNVYIADTGNNRVVKVRPDGSQTEVGSGLSIPTGLAVDPEGTVFIADRGNNRVVKVPAGGGPQTVAGSGIVAPTSVALDAFGNLFANDRGSGIVWKLPADGSPKIQLPRPLVPGGKVYSANAVAVHAPPPTLTADAPPGNAGVGTTYSYRFRAATPPNEPPARFRVASGVLPPGLRVDPDTGVLSGNPTKPGTYAFRVQTENRATGSLGAPHVITVADSIAMPMLVVARDGTGTGKVSSTPAVIDCPGTCAAGFGAGTEVTLTADPAPGSTFAGWSGGGCSGTDPCTVTMDAARTVTATFTAGGQRDLSVATAGPGAGTVTSAPSGIECGSACSASFATGTRVVLSAAAAPGSVFAGWTGGGCSGTGTCAVTLDAQRSVTASFDRVPPGQQALRVGTTGLGAGTVTSAPAGIRCGTACSALFAEGALATLTATPEAGSRFTGWSGGGCSGTGPCTVALSSDRSVTADFAEVAAPVLWALGLQPRRYAATARRPRIALRFRLDQAATVRITIARLAKRRTVRLRGSLRANGVEGANRVRFDGRFGGRRLKPGRYRLTATPTADGLAGASRSALLTVSR